MNKAECKSILDYKEFPSYDICYTDPPWEERMTKWFRTKMRKDVGHAPEFSFHAIISQLGQLTDKTKPLYIEYDKNAYKGIIDKMEGYGHTLMDISKFPLYQNSTQVLLSFNTDILPFENSNNFQHSIIDMLSRHGKGLQIFDPFAGIGFTAKMVMQSGNYYHGSELNPARYRKLKEVIEQNGHIKKA